MQYNSLLLKLTTAFNTTNEKKWIKRASNDENSTELSFVLDFNLSDLDQ